jgi:uncharacterized protein (TIGR02145 family)
MKKSIYLYIYLSICLSVSLNGQSTNSQDVGKGESIQRNATYNLEEIKVRWKKAALENCTGVPCVPFNCGTSAISDIDGNSYNTVLIGTQCWTKENLKVTKYNDGTPIPDETANTAGWGGGLDRAARSDYTGATSIAYGYLYNWYAAKGVSSSGSTSYKNICPTGWHVSTYDEWTALGTQLGGLLVAGGKLKSTVTNVTRNSGLGWNPASPPSPGTDDYGFSALPGGYNDGTFREFRESANFWTATDFSSSYAYTRVMTNIDSWLRNPSQHKSTGLSVRCLKD